MTEEMKSKMNEVANSEEFKKEFGKADSPEALAEIFEKFGLEMTAADVEAFMAEIPDEEDIEKDIAYHDGNIGYHVKTGKHSITHFDWKMYLDFLDLKK